MFDFFRKKRITKYTGEASEYLQQAFTPETSTPKESPAHKAIVKTILRTETDVDGNLPSKNEDVKHQAKKRQLNRDPDVRYSLPNSDSPSSDARLESGADSDNRTRYSLRDSDDTNENLTLGDAFSASAVDSAMHKYNKSARLEALFNALENAVNKTFVDSVVTHIDKKGLRDSEVYKAAQLDRRLFSKIMSNRQYKPSKDTAIAIALALHLTLNEATDMLSRAGYTFSHSNKKDIIIEYFFRERIYKLDDINEVLYNLGQKTIGR